VDTGCVQTLDFPTAKVVVLRGELDVGSCGDLAEMIEESFEKRPVVIVDMTEATFMDSTVLQAVLVGHHHHQREPRHAFALVAVPGEPIERFLRVVAVPSLIPIYPSREAALDALAAHQAPVEE
jgi:anti-anti-sigma factor